MPTLIMERLEYAAAGKARPAVRLPIFAEAADEADEAGTTGDRLSQVGPPPRHERPARQRQEPGN